MTTWFVLQQQVHSWGMHNFGPQPAWQPMLGFVEELGEFFMWREKYFNISDPTIFTTTPIIEARLQMTDALADQAVFALTLAQSTGIQFQNIVTHLDVSPQNLSDAQITGVLAAACHAVLKEALGVRGYDFNRRREEVEICLAMWLRWANYQVVRHGFRPMLEVVGEVWEVVRKRDWKKNPKDASEMATISTVPNIGTLLAVAAIGNGQPAGGWVPMEEPNMAESKKYEGMFKADAPEKQDPLSPDARKAYDDHDLEMLMAISLSSAAKPAPNIRECTVCGKPEGDDTCDMDIHRENQEYING